jgi:hypothetical protein
VSLIAWQWDIYPSAHRDRRNLLIHLVTNPLFIAGVLAVPAGLVTQFWLTSIFGVVVMPLVMFVQGRGHKLEKEPPAPFRGPLDVVGRIFAEQLINFPRFVITGKWIDAWFAAKS